MAGGSAWHPGMRVKTKRTVVGIDEQVYDAGTPGCIWRVDEDAEHELVICLDNPGYAVHLAQVDRQAVQVEPLLAVQSACVTRDTILCGRIVRSAASEEPNIAKANGHAPAVTECLRQASDDEIGFLGGRRITGDVLHLERGTVGRVLAFDIKLNVYVVKFEGMRLVADVAARDVQPKVGLMKRIASLDIFRRRRSSLADTGSATTAEEAERLLRRRSGVGSDDGLLVGIREANSTVSDLDTTQPTGIRLLPGGYSSNNANSSAAASREHSTGGFGIRNGLRGRVGLQSVASAQATTSPLEGVGVGRRRRSTFSNSLPGVQRVDSVGHLEPAEAAGVVNNPFPASPSGVSNVSFVSSAPAVTYPAARTAGSRSPSPARDLAPPSLLNVPSQCTTPTVSGASGVSGTFSPLGITPPQSPAAASSAFIGSPRPSSAATPRAASPVAGVASRPRGIPIAVSAAVRTASPTPSSSASPQSDALPASPRPPSVPSDGGKALKAMPPGVVSPLKPPMPPVNIISKNKTLHSI